MILLMFLHLFIGFIVGVTLYKYDYNLDLFEFGILGNIFLWPLTLILILSLLIVYGISIVASFFEKKLENLVDKVLKR